MRANEAPPDVRFRDVMTTHGNAIADTVERLRGRIHGDKVKHDSVADPSRGIYMAKYSSTGKGSFDQMRPASVERVAPSPQRVARRDYRTEGWRVAQNLIRIDRFQGAETADACQGGLAAPVRTGNHVESRHGRSYGASESEAIAVGQGDDAIPFAGAGDIGAVRSDAVQSSARVELSRKYGPDLIAPVLRESGYFRWCWHCIATLIHANEYTFNRAVEH